MLRWILIFLVFAILAGALGFTGIAGTSAAIAQVLFYLFLVLFVLSLPTLNEQIQLNGEVKWVVSEESAGSDDPPGMGIKFKFDTEADRTKVDDFVERLDFASGILAWIKTRIQAW